MAYSTLFLPHGGGPLPLLDHPPHASLTHFLKTIPGQLIAPSAIVVVTAHWEASPFEIGTAARPGMMFDYYGFPPESYEFQYPAPGAPALGEQLIDALNRQGVPAVANPSRGYDHGTFIPLMLMFPAAEIPVLQVSLNTTLSPDLHLNYGRLLGQTLPEDVLIIGSGLSFHNLRSQFANMDNDQSSSPESQAFHNWLNDSLSLPAEEMIENLNRWTSAPQARYCHPREEHLLPLHVIAGAAAARMQPLNRVYNDVLMGHQVSAFAG